MRLSHAGLLCPALTACVVCAATVSADEARWRDLRLQGMRYMQEHRLIEAARSSLETIEEARRTFGPHAVETAEDLNNAGLVFFYLNDYEQSERLYREAIRTYDDRLGFAHRKSMAPRRNLARLLHVIGRLDAAETAYLEAVELMERCYGPSHRNTEECLYNLGQLYIQTGRPDQARPLLERALRIRVARSGPEAPEVVDALEQLAAVYRAMQMGPATLQPMYERIRRIREREWGANDPRLEPVLLYLAETAARRSRPGEAAELYRRALAMQEQTDGPDIPPGMEGMTNFATAVFSGVGTADLLVMWERPVGTDHRGRIATLTGLGDARVLEGRPAEAVPVLQRAAAVCERAYGPDHPETARVLRALAGACLAAGDLARAQPLYERLVATCERARRADDERLDAYLGILAQIYFDQQRYGDVITAYRQQLAALRARLGDTHPRLATALNNLAEVYRLEKRYEEAEPLYTEAVRLLEDCEPGDPARAEYPTVLRNLESFYREQGRRPEADNMAARLAALEQDLPALAAGEAP